MIEELGERMRKQTACLVFLALLLVSTLAPLVNITPVKAWNGTVYIHADGSIDPSTAPIQQNGDLYTLSDNIISDGDGIVIERSSIEIDGNGHTIQGSYGGSGVNLTSVNEVTIRNINVQDFYYGILIVSASQTTISGNKLTANNIGIVLLDSSDYNSMNGNNINGNDIGIWVDTSSNNNICHNSFLGNTPQVGTYDSANIWDDAYPAGGNYWSDYTGVDEKSGPYQDQPGSDGIGDTPYVIDASNRDRYPLMVAVTIPGDLNGDFKVSLADLVTLAIAYGSKLGDSNWNPNADIDGNSVVGLSDLVILANHYGQQFP
jgi:parallel beta-helix repeat protein